MMDATFIGLIETERPCPVWMVSNINAMTNEVEKKIMQSTLQTIRIGYHVYQYYSYIHAAFVVGHLVYRTVPYVKIIWTQRQKHKRKSVPTVPMDLDDWSLIDHKDT